MTDHYYTVSPTSISKPKEITYKYRNTFLKFLTDHGVFSYDNFDKGSHVLLKYLPTLSGKVLDLGCGWGGIGISLLKTKLSLDMTMVDINSRAIELTKANCSINGVVARVVQGDGFANLNKDMKFDAIVTNPPIRAGKAVVYDLFKVSAKRLYPEGKLFLVVGKKQGAASAHFFLTTLFKNVLIIKKESGYWVFCCENAL